MILVGDFFQLAPMADLHQQAVGAAISPHVAKYRRPAAKYVFESEVWDACKFVPYRLHHCWRYDVNSALGRFLTKLRVSEKLEDDLYFTLEGMLVQDDDLPETCVRLVTRKTDARTYSIDKLHSIVGEDVADHVFYAVDSQGGHHYVNSEADEFDKAQPVRHGPDH